MSDEERDLRKYSRRSAIGLMGVGGGLAATETLGFTNLTADRTVDVDVVGDDEAVLTIVGTGGVNTEGGDNEDEPLEDPDSFDEELQIDFTNQSDTDIEGQNNDGDLDVTITNQEGSGGTIEVTGFGETDEAIDPDANNTFQTGLDSEETDDLIVAMQEDDGTENATIDVTVDAVFGGGDFSVNLDREDIDINGVDSE